MSISNVIVGNSSSGIIEAPSIGVPTVNVGIRQGGRIKAKSVLSCNGNSINIVKAIKKALSKKFLQMAKKCDNPYFKKNTTVLITNKLKKIDSNNLLLKSFYNIK